MMQAAQLRNRRCQAGSCKLSDAEVMLILANLPGWEKHGIEIRRTFTFDRYEKVIGFVAAVAWVAQREDHHPTLVVEYGKCSVNYSTHSAGGITENDLICAAKVDALVE